MKKIFLSFIALTFVTSSFAKSNFTCLEIYQRVANHKMDKRDRVNNGGEIAAGGAVMYLLNPAGALVVALGLGVAIYNSTRPSEWKVLKLNEEGNKFNRRLMKKALKIDPEVTTHDVAAIINNGFETGTFCKNFPELSSKQEIQNYVLQTISGI